MQQYKEKLEAELAQVMEELTHKAPALDIDPADESEVADKMEELGETSAVFTSLEVRRNEVMSALEKIENGTYGICEIGGEPIEPDRLEANPAARTCKLHMNG
jgi:DnaK suppressor protein